MIRRALTILVNAVLLAACASGSDNTGLSGSSPATETAASPLVSDLVPVDYDLGLPDWMPLPLEPSSNRLNAAKAELGRRLFYDTRLSADQTTSCASCHKQELAFTDGLSGIAGRHWPAYTAQLNVTCERGLFTRPDMGKPATTYT